MDQYNYSSQQYPRQVESPPAHNLPPQYGYPYPSTPDPYHIPELKATVDAAFSKCLASMIMSFFPFVSFIAIFVAIKGLKLVSKANDIAAYYGVEAGEKNVTAKVFGIIGKIAGIVSSAESVLLIFYIIFYTIYFIYYFSQTAVAGI